ncbi:MAG: VOC family protein [Clostridiales bacterium]|nr:VOC family protein [Clostridiales bacterium]
MKFLWVTLRVKDLEESLKFYQDMLGLEVDSRFQAGPASEIAFLCKGQTKLELLCDKNEKVDTGQGGVTIGFEVSALEEAMELVKSKGYEILGQPVVINENLRFFFVKDPDGYTVQLVENK